MNWTRASEYHMTSDEGHSVCKYETASGWLYEAWGIGGSGIKCQKTGRRMLATRLPSKEAAMAICVREGGKENAVS